MPIYAAGKPFRDISFQLQNHTDSFAPICVPKCNCLHAEFNVSLADRSGADAAPSIRHGCEPYQPKLPAHAAPSTMRSPKLSN